VEKNNETFSAERKYAKEEQKQRKEPLGKVKRIYLFLNQI